MELNTMGPHDEQFGLAGAGDRRTAIHVSIPLVFRRVSGQTGFGAWPHQAELFPGAVLRDRKTTTGSQPNAAPWDYSVDTARLRMIPTLVVTGDWNEEYDAIAIELEHVGATHVHLTGYGHRVQDHPASLNETITRFVAAV